MNDIYGFPGMEGFDHKFPICLVFVHSPQEYFPTIIILVVRKQKLGNVNDWERDYIIWHVKQHREVFWSRADKVTRFGTDEDIMNYFLK
jgi:hypothetical protein